MNYTIVSKTGWRAGAHTQSEAQAKANKHAQEWREVGREIEVNVYHRDGALVYSTTKGK